MLSNLIYTILLGPVLLLQGLYIKKRTPELPEPVGPRAGIIGDGELMRILIVGDSAAAGVGVLEQFDALSGQLIKELSLRYCVHWRLIAKTGLNTQELIEELNSVDENNVDIVVSSLGVNDVTSGTSCKQFKRQQLDLYSLLLDRFSARHIIVNKVPPMHEFPALPQPLRWFLGNRAQALNIELSELVASDSRLNLMSIDFPVDKEFFADDGFHPSKKAYQFWGEKLAVLICDLNVSVFDRKKSQNKSGFQVKS